jgi:hypothetical protein
VNTVVDKRIKSADSRPIKATKLALDMIRANEITIENSETGKVTAVVAILKVFGGNTRNSRNTNPKKLLNKPNKRLNLKKKHLNRSGVVQANVGQKLLTSNILSTFSMSFFALRP